MTDESVRVLDCSKLRYGPVPDGLGPRQLNAGLPERMTEESVHVLDCSSVVSDGAAILQVPRPRIVMTITPKMIEAGCAELMGSGRVSENLPDRVARSIVEDILRAALLEAGWPGRAK